MGDIDPQEFGELKGTSQATHDMLKEFMDDYKDDKDKVHNIDKRVTTIETRNKMVARSAFGVGALYGGWKALMSWFI